MNVVEEPSLKGLAISGRQFWPSGPTEIRCVASEKVCIWELNGLNFSVSTRESKIKVVILWRCILYQINL